MLETRAGWPEVAVSMYIARGVLTLMLYRFGAHFAGNPVDRRLFSLCLQDKARHLAYGQAMLKHTVAVKGPTSAYRCAASSAPLKRIWPAK